MMKIFILLLTFFMLMAPVTGYSQGNERSNSSPVVVELFSSQGCPACPPADKYLGQLAKAGNVIALSCHVDYFDVRGANNLGKYLCTKRQETYMYQHRSKTMYTPQMIINGHRNVIGYETAKVAKQIGQGRAENIANIQITPSAEGVYTFTIPEQNFSTSTDLMLVAYDQPHHLSERGRKASYYNVIHHIMPLGEWKGGAISRAVYPVVNSRHAGFAIIAQDRRTGKILAAGDFRL